MLKISSNLIPYINHQHYFLNPALKSSVLSFVSGGKGRRRKQMTHIENPFGSTWRALSKQKT